PACTPPPSDAAPGATSSTNPAPPTSNSTPLPSCPERSRTTTRCSPRPVRGTDTARASDPATVCSAARCRRWTDPGGLLRAPSGQHGTPESPASGRPVQALPGQCPGGPDLVHLADGRLQPDRVVQVVQGVGELAGADPDQAP